MIACAGVWTWVGFWIFGMIVGILLMGMGRNPARLAVVDVRDLSKASHPPRGPVDEDDHPPGSGPMGF